MAHKKIRSKAATFSEVTMSKLQATKKEKRNGRRNMFVLGIFLLLTLSIAGIANWRTLNNYKSNAALIGSPNASSAATVNMPPVLPADRPSKEFVYSGGSLLATVEPFREAPDDFAVWRPGNGVWYVSKSSANGALLAVQWGQSGDFPVPAPYRR